MKVNVSSVLSRTDTSMEFSGEINISSISFNNDEIAVISPIRVNVVVTNTGSDLLLTGKINTILSLKCSRCLESFDYILCGDFEEELSNKDDGEDVIYFDGDTIDITDIVINNIFLSLPMKAVCSESCMGLCPSCGSNNNFHECSCESEDLDPRLAVLKDLLKGN